MQVSATTLAQRITIKGNPISLKAIFTEIKKQTGFQVLYQSAQLNKAKPIKIALNNVPLEEAMPQILADQQLDFEIEDKTIIIKERSPSLLDKLSNVISNMVRNLTIKGRVVDQDGKPLPNASIRVKGKSAVTNTNSEGEFEIKGVDEDAVLLVSYVGYKTLEIALKDAVMPLEIKLNAATGELEEVKVVYNTGYQELNKERATGSFVQIDNKSIKRGVSTNILDRISYLTSSLRKGGNGEASVNGTDISIRGLSTVNANQKPLIVIDGFPYEEYIFGFGGQIILNNLNPNDVESATILRDAAAASIWGARSANGVIVITTKKGKFDQKANVSFFSNTTIGERPDLFKANIMSSNDMIDYEKKLFKIGVYNDYDDLYPSSNSFPSLSSGIELLLANRRGEISDSQTIINLEKLRNNDVRNDVNKYLLRSSVNQQYNLNVSGGSNKMNYYGSIGYDKELKSAIGNEYNRLTLRLDNNYRITNNIELNTYVSYTQSKTQNNGISYDQYIANGINQVSPYTMLADENGNLLSVPKRLRSSYIDTVKTRGLVDWHYNPIEEISNQDNTDKLSTIRFGGGLIYKIIQGLNLNLKGQYDHSLSNSEDYKSIRSYEVRDNINTYMFLNALGQPQYPIPLGGTLNFRSMRQTSYNLQGQLNFSKTFDAHAISAIGGFNVNESQRDLNSNKKWGYDPLTLGFANNMDYNTRYAMRASSGNTGTIPKDNGSLSGSLNRSLSYYSNVGYTLLNKYTLNASARIDAANLFGVKANLKAKPTWSFGTGWNISKEDFFDVGSISSLSLRATYGYNGNVDNNATSFPVIRYQLASLPYSIPQQYATSVSPPNPGLTWEKVKVINLGLDISMFGNRLIGSVDYYIKKAGDLISSQPVDPTVGVNSYTGNFGALKAEGIDLNLTALVLNYGIKVNSAISLSYNKEEITDYYLAPSLLIQPLNYLSNQVLAGKPRNYLYSYRWAGLNSQTGDPMGVVDGQIVPFTTVLGSTGVAPNTHPTDLIYHGRSTAPVFGNMLNTISYKGFSTSFNITYAFGYYFRRPSVNFSLIQYTWGGHGDYKNRWQKPGDELFTNVPSLPLMSDGRDEFYAYSEVLVEKADHIRLRDIRLSYDLNKGQVRKFPFTNISFYVLANDLNVLLWRANNHNIDPENLNKVPNPRSISVGLTLNY